jgi:hypothetical protein
MCLQVASDSSQHEWDGQIGIERIVGRRKAGDKLHAMKCKNRAPSRRSARWDARAPLSGTGGLPRGIV